MDLDKIRNALQLMKGLRDDLERVDSSPPNSATFEETQRDPDTVRDAETSSNTTEQLPRSIGRFEIQRKIGQGGFARVYLASDPELDREVALKVLKPTRFFSEDATGRFEREARAAALLSHPNIVPIFETGIEASDRYIVSEFCDGSNLEQWLKRQDTAVRPRQAARIVMTLAEAVEHAHQRGVIHRDLKPANIMVEVDNGRGADPDPYILPEKVRITDFGLARYDNSSDQFQTAEGAIVGTPAYMSPEQADERQEAGNSSDVYSLGVILYELLTGKLPIVGKTHIDTLLAIQTQEPKTPRQLNPSVPKDLQAICLKCLEKSPDHRYASAHELASDLARWLAGEVVHARNPTLIDRLYKWTIRNPALAIAFTGVSIALIVALLQWRSATIENRRADRHLDLSHTVIDEMVSRVASDPNLPPELRRGVTQRAVELQVQLLAEVPDDLDSLLQTAKAYRQFAIVLADLSEYDAALEAIDESIALVEPHLDHPEMASEKMSAARVKAGILRYTQRNEEALDVIEEAEVDTAQTSLDQARNRFENGLSKMRSNQLEEALLEFEAAYTLFGWDADSQHVNLDLARLHHFYGVTEMKLDNLEEAKRRIQLSQQIFSDIYDVHPERVDTLENYARCHLQLARIARGQASDPTLANDAIEEYVDQSRGYFDQSEALFRQLHEKSPLLRRYFGQLAMVFEIRIRLETEQQNKELAESTADRFAILFDELPEDLIERRPIGRILAESRIKIARMLIEIDDEPAAIEQLQSAQELLDQLIEEFPGVEKLEIANEECLSLLEQLGTS